MIASENRTEEVSNFLSTAVGEVFETMLKMAAQPVKADAIPATAEPAVTASVGFTGEANGVVSIRVTAAFARVLAARMLGMEQEEIEGDEMISDAIGELSNMIVGSVKSRLCDEGLPCVLSIPAIIRGQNFCVAKSEGLDYRLLAFQCGGDHLVMELQMKR